MIFSQKSPQKLFSVIPADPGSSPGQAPETGLFYKLQIDTGIHRHDDIFYEVVKNNSY